MSFSTISRGNGAISPLRPRSGEISGIDSRYSLGRPVAYHRDVLDLLHAPLFEWESPQGSRAPSICPHRAAYAIERARQLSPTPMMAMR